MALIYIAIKHGKRGNPSAVTEYIEQMQHCKLTDTSWMVDTQKNTTTLALDLGNLVGSDGIAWTGRIHKQWNSHNANDAAQWLKSNDRNWEEI